METLARCCKGVALGLLAGLLPALPAGQAGAAQDAAGAGTGAEQPAPRAPEQDGAAVPVPLRAFTDDRGRSCRVYARAVIIDGEARTALATVCREPNGRWVLSR